MCDIFRDCLEQKRNKKKSLDLFIFFVVKNNIIHHTHRAKKKEVTFALAISTLLSFAQMSTFRVNDQWTLTNCQVIDTKGATDHNGILAEFELKSM